MDLGSTGETLTVYQVLAFFCTWMGGVLVNYVNRVAREGMDWKDYWTHNPIKVLSSLFVSLGICITLLVDGEANHLTYFSVAFMAENLINTPRKDQTDVSDKGKSNVEDKG